MPGASITIAGVDRTLYVRGGVPNGPGISLSSRSGGGATCNFQTIAQNNGAVWGAFVWGGASWGSGYLPQRDDTVVVKNGAGLTLFTGFVDKVERETDGTAGMWGMVQCVDLAVLLTRRRVGAVYGPTFFTNYMILLFDLIFLRFPDTGINVPFSTAYVPFLTPLAGEVRFPWVTVAEALNQIGTALNCDWAISNSPVGLAAAPALHYFPDPAISLPSPVNFDDVIYSNLLGDNPAVNTKVQYKSWMTMKIQDSGQRFANRVTAKTSTAVILNATETFVGPGTYTALDSGLGANAYVMAEKLTSAPTVTLNGAAQTVTLFPGAAGSQFYYEDPADDIGRVQHNDSLFGVIADSDVVMVTYPTTLKGAVSSQDSASIEAVGTFDYILEASNVSNSDDLQALADAMLARLEAHPLNFVATTRVDGFEPGQTVHIDIVELNVSADFLVQSVQSRQESSGYFIHSISGSTMPQQDLGGAAFFQKLIAQTRTPPPS